MKDLYTRIIERALPQALIRAKAFCESKQLRGLMEYVVVETGDKKASGIVNVPHFWAIYYHEGRKIITKDGGYLVWFRNINDDPRLNNGQAPVYRSDVRKLTEGQWRDWIAKNKEARRKGQPPPMIVSTRSPINGKINWHGNKFFSNAAGEGMSGMAEEFKQIAKEEAFSYMEEWLKATGLKKAKINIRIG